VNLRRDKSFIKNNDLIPYARGIMPDLSGIINLSGQIDLIISGWRKKGGILCQKEVKLRCL
jgi:hypothetical protein